MPSRLRASFVRTRTLGFPWIVLTFAGALLVSRNAMAHDRSVVVSLDGGTCVAQSALHDAVASRGGRIAEDAPVHLRVKVDARRDGRVGIEIGGRGAHGVLAERRFVASSCAEATDALGLVIALAGDEAEKNDVVMASPSSANDPPAAEPAPPPNETTATAETLLPVPAEPAAEMRTPSVEPSPPSRFALGAGAIGTTLGEGQIGARLAGTLEWRRSLFPWVEVSASANVPRTIEGGGGGADATWIAGRFAAAPIGIELGARSRLSAFGAVDAGVLRVSGSGATRVDTATRPWFALAAGARVRWDLGERWFGGLDAAALVPLVRDDFVFLNGGTAYRVPAVAMESQICMGAHFP